MDTHCQYTLASKYVPCAKTFGALLYTSLRIAEPWIGPLAPETVLPQFYLCLL